MSETKGDSNAQKRSAVSPLPASSNDDLSSPDEAPPQEKQVRLDPSASWDPDELSTEEDLLSVLLESNDEEDVEGEHVFGGMDERSITRGVSSDEESEDEAPFGAQWSTTKPQTESRFPFQGQPPPSAQPLRKPIDYFLAFFPREMQELLVNETNSYADLKNSKNDPKFMTWKDLDLEEFKLFIGLLLHMGTMPSGTVPYFWRPERVCLGLESFNEFMEKDRFVGILQALHAARNPDPLEPKPSDLLYKIRPLLNTFHRTIHDLVPPSRELSVDESVILWRGKVIFREDKIKALPHGMKVYMLTDPSGLARRFMVFKGADDKEVDGRHLNEAFTQELLEGYLDRGHSLFMNNYYNSVELAHQLLDRKTYLTGTLVPKRAGNPRDVTKAKVPRGKCVERFDRRGVSVSKCRGLGPMISSEYTGETPGGGRKDIPQILSMYNKYFYWAADLLDLMVCYPLQRVAMRWSKKMIIHVIHACLINAFHLYRRSHPKTHFLSFRLKVIRTLLSPRSGV